MRYNVEVLKKMIDNLSSNIEMFSKYGENAEQRMYDMVRERRGLAALVENDGYPIDGVTVDSMSYSAAAGADTSWWTKGT